MSSVTLDQGGPFRLRHRTDRILAGTARLVERHMRETLPPTTVRLVHASGFGDAVLESVGEKPSWWRAARAWDQHRRGAREAAGLTLPTHDGHVLVLLHILVVRDPDQLFPTLVHELVHAVQFGRPGVADRVLTAHRCELGLVRQSRRWVADYDRAVEIHEDEAYRIEHRLAARTGNPVPEPLFMTRP